MAESNALIAVDAGTTNTRVWLVVDGQAVAHAAAMTGVRDTAREGTNAKLKATLRELIAQVRAAHPDVQPACVAAAGMITSPLGLAEVPHVNVPAGLYELRERALRCAFPDVADLPFILVPGVRCGTNSLEDCVRGDVMRGEETLCVGLLATMQRRLPLTVFNLGSHWKAIRLDHNGDIASSLTTLAGELIHATQSQTILASAVPAGKAATLDWDWCERGIEQQLSEGVARALFCVRLLELQGETSPAQRMSFLLGVYLGEALAAMRPTDFFHPASPVLLTGSGAVADAWLRALTELQLDAVLLTEAEIEQAFLRGISELARVQPR